MNSRNPLPLGRGGCQFYRDTTAHEVDLICQKGSQLIPIEIKSGKTFSPSFLNGLQYFHKQTTKADDGVVIYRGEKSQKLGVLATT